MNKILIGTAISAAVVGAVAFAPMIVNAETTRYGAREGGQYGRQASLESRASVFGMTGEELEAQISAGKTMLQVAEEKGLSVEDFQAKMREAAKQRWEERGLSAEEVQKRLDWQAERQAGHDVSAVHRGMGGYGRLNR